MSDAYASAGVDTHLADQGVAAIVNVLRTIETGRESLAVPLPGHYASVMRLPGSLAPNVGIAIATDSVGSKVIVAEQTGRFDTIGIDCVAMNVNDLICVGAQPLALLDYIAVERAEPRCSRRSGAGWRSAPPTPASRSPAVRSARSPRSCAATPRRMASTWSAPRSAWSSWTS